MSELEIDKNVDISKLSETMLTNVIIKLRVVRFIGTKISNKQMTEFLTRVLNEGTTLEEVGLQNIIFPKVHPNILGPGLAQFPTVDLSGK